MAALSNGLGYGLDYWGVGPWGISPASGVFEVEGAFATSERTLRVTFADEALVGTVLTEGGALNTRSWSVTGPGAQPNLILLSVREVDGSGGRQFELYFLRKLPPWPATVTVSAANVLAADGSPLVGTPSRAVQGASQPRVTPTRNRTTDVDLRVAQLPGATLATTLLTTAGGDYDTEGGTALLKKLILRRLTTAPGAFKFIPKDRFGLAVSVKGSLRTAAGLMELELHVEQQVLMEPDVATAKAKATYLVAQGVVQIALSVQRSSTGQMVPMGFTLTPTDDIQL